MDVKRFSGPGPVIVRLMLATSSGEHFIVTTAAVPQQELVLAVCNPGANTAKVAKGVCVTGGATGSLRKKAHAKLSFFAKCAMCLGGGPPS